LMRPSSRSGLEKSKELPQLYGGVAQLGGAAFFDAGTVISTRAQTPFI
jgi:hypothetical protein